MYSPSRTLNKAYLYQYEVLPSVALKTYLGYDESAAIDPNNGGSISGNLKTKDVPTNNATVLLYESGFNTFITKTTTDSSGFFEFKNLNKRLKFHIVIVNSITTWEHRTISRLSPV